MSPQATNVFTRIKRDYKQHVRKDPHSIPSFSPRSQGENLPFVELEAQGLLKKHTGTDWILTKRGQMAALA